jgi:hypothetical protein
LEIFERRLVFSSSAFAACRTINSDTMTGEAGATDVDDAAWLAQFSPFSQDTTAGHGCWQSSRSLWNIGEAMIQWWAACFFMEHLTAYFRKEHINTSKI